jgi:tetratricopeptide (TPR) repeat protein
VARFVSALVLLAALLLITFHETPESFTSQRVLARRRTASLYEDHGRGKVEVGKVRSGILTVLDEQKGWLKVRSGPDTAWLPMKDAVLLDDAVPYFSRRIRVAPNDAWYYAQRSLAQQATGNLQEALQDCTQAITLEPGEAVLFVQRGAVYAEMRMAEPAIRDYTEAIRLDPKASETYVRRGMVYVAIREDTRAVGDFTLAVQLNPVAVVAYMNRGVALQRQGKLDRALADFSQVLRLDATSATALFHRGIVFLSLKDYSDALRDLQESVHLAPGNLAALDRLAWVLATCPKAEVRNGSEAVRVATQACKLSNWENPECLGTLAAAFAEVGNFAEATKWQQRAVQLAEDHPDSFPGGRERLTLYTQHQPYRSE